MSHRLISKIAFEFSTNYEVTLNKDNIQNGVLYKKGNIYRGTITLKNSRRRRINNLTNGHLINGKVSSITKTEWDGVEHLEVFEDFELIDEVNLQKAAADKTKSSREVIIAKNKLLMYYAECAASVPDIDMYILQLTENGDILMREQDIIRKNALLYIKRREQQCNKEYYESQKTKRVAK